MKLIESLKNEKSIKVHLNAKNWKEAIYLSCEPLIISKAIKKEYYYNIIESTEKFGPYYIIAPGLAMPHAQSNTNVLRDAFSLITLKKPIKFEKDDRNINILITLAATSPDIHTGQALPQIAAAFENQEIVDKIAAAKSEKEILLIFKSIDLDKYLQKEEK